MRESVRNHRAIIAFLLAMAVTMSCVLGASAAFIRTIEAPGGVGDVVALTNVLTQFSALSDDDRKNARIWLQPGTYNLSGVYMNSTHHLSMSQSAGGLFAGLGDGPEDTVLVGGGETEAHGVLVMGGGGNFGFNTISNLTITGGWTTSNGGAVSGSSSSVYRNLIVSNNCAKGTGNGAGGGGCFKGRAYNCLFANNRTSERWGGGMATGSETYCNMSPTEGQGAWSCTFVGKSAYQCGGGLAINGGGRCVGCCFTNNTTSGNGGGVFVQTVNYRSMNKDGYTPLTSKIVDCVFVGNGGGGFHTAAGLVGVSNCVFRLNKGGATAIRGDIKDSIFECNTNDTGVVGNSAMERCVVRNNAVKNRYATAIDYCADGTTCYTNVNCLIESNGYLDEYGKLLYRKAYVNCTIIGNYIPNGGNYGYLERNCTFWNCVLWGNKISTSTQRDVRTMDMYNNPLAVAMTNCVFVSSDLDAADIGADGVITHDGFGNCRQIAKAALKLVDVPNGDYTPSTRSPLYDKGLADDWIVDLVGYRDLADGQRIFGRGLDIGAYECQLDKPGMMLIFR